MPCKSRSGDRLPRYLVQITDAYPELLADLRLLPPRAGADRLRLLATLGLAVLHHGLGGAPPPAAPAAQPDQTLIATRRRLLSAIGGSAS